VDREATLNKKLQALKAKASIL